MHVRRSLLALVGAAALATASIAAAPTADTTEVAVDGDTVTVTGTLADPLGPMVIGTDPADDAIGSGLGVDVSEYAVSVPDADTIAFHVTLGDANPATGYFPQGTALEIAPTIGDDAVELTAVATLDGGLEFGAQECAPDPDTGVNSCTTTPVEGSYEDGVVTWLLPSTLTPGAPVNGTYVHVNYHVGTGATGGVTFVNGLLDEMGISAYAQVPTAELLVDGQVAGTAVLSDAGYEVTATGLAVGEHTLAVRLCSAAVNFDFTPTECTDVELAPITVESPTG